MGLNKIRMKFLSAIAIIGCAAAKKSWYIDPQNPGHVKPAVMPVDNVHTPLLHVSDVPEQWVWNDVNNTNYLTTCSTSTSPSTAALAGPTLPLLPSPTELRSRGRLPGPTSTSPPRCSSRAKVTQMAATVDTL